MVLGVVCEFLAGAVGFDAVAAGDRVADKFNPSGAAFGGVQHLSAVRQQKAAEFGAFLIAFDGIRHTHSMLVVVKVGGESRHRIVFGEVDFKWSEVVKFHHEMSAARLCKHRDR